MSAREGSRFAALAAASARLRRTVPATVASSSSTASPDSVVAEAPDSASSSPEARARTPPRGGAARARRIEAGARARVGAGATREDSRAAADACARAETRPLFVLPRAPTRASAAVDAPRETIASMERGTPESVGGRVGTLRAGCARGGVVAEILSDAPVKVSKKAAVIGSSGSATRALRSATSTFRHLAKLTRKQTMLPVHQSHAGSDLFPRAPVTTFGS